MQGSGVSLGVLIQRTKNEEKLYVWAPALSRLHKRGVILLHKRRITGKGGEGTGLSPCKHPGN